MTKRHLVIPDTQVKKGVPTRHLSWIAQAIDEYKPDAVVHIGDHWDMPSLSMYDAPGSLKMEGARIEDDIEAGNRGFELLNQASHKCKRFFHVANHEYRIVKAINRDPKLAGTIGLHLLKTPGWQWVDYYNGSPGQNALDGIMFAHFFSQVNTGKPIGGTIQNRLAKIGQSFVQGHVQGLMQGNLQLATGRTIQGIQCGSAYLHDEEFKGQANRHWRGIVVLNEVHKGEFCEMPLSLDYLCRKYEGMGVSRFLQKNYRDARHRFSLTNKE